MKEIKNKVLKTFEHDNYLIYLIDENDSYGFYMQNVSYGIISLIFGFKKAENTLKDTINMVESNLDNYIQIYKNLYED